jgi:hypothetical protein
MLEIRQDDDRRLEVYTPSAFDVSNTGFYKNFTCDEESSMTYETMYLVLAPMDCSVTSYFESLRKMISGKFEHKYNLPRVINTRKGGLKKFYAKNPGTGMLFVSYVVGARQRSMFVPALTYSGSCCCGCNVDKLSSLLTIIGRTHPSVIIIIIGILQTVGGISSGLMNLCKLEKIDFLKYLATLEGVFLAAFIMMSFSGVISNWILVGGFVIMFIANQLVIIYAGPRVSSAILNFIIYVILLYVVSTVIFDTPSWKWAFLLLGSLLMMALTAVLEGLQIVGAVSVLAAAVGICVIAMGANMIMLGYLYDYFLNPAMAELNTMAEMVY